MEKFKNFLVWILDLFYPVFKPFLKRHTYDYIVCGGGNTLLGFVLFYIAYHHVFQQQNFDLGLFVLKPHIASFFFSFFFTFPLGFFMSRYIVWSESELKGKHQLMRYFILVFIFFFVNYGILKLFVEYLNWWPLPSQVLTTAIIVVFSYLSQKHYSFK